MIRLTERTLEKFTLEKYEEELRVFRLIVTRSEAGGSHREGSERKVRVGGLF